MLRTNESTIETAFARFVAQKDAYIAEKFAELMRFGLEALLEAHDMPIVGKNIFHHNQLEKETLGWAIYHNGVEVAAGSQNRGSLEGSVQFRIEDMLSGTKEWVGVIMSEMSFDWYRVDYEMDFLLYSRDEIRENFSKIFTPMKAKMGTISFG